MRCSLRKPVVSNLEDARGLALVEMCLVLFLLMTLVGGAIDCGVLFFGAQTLQNASREAARLGSTLPDLVQNDTRIGDEALFRLQYAQLLSGLSNFGVTNTAALSKAGVTTAAGEPCDLEFTVTTSANIRLIFLQVVGISNLLVRRHVTMRYHLQPLCS